MRVLTAYNVLALLACAGLGAWTFSEAKEVPPALPERPDSTVAVQPAMPPAPQSAFRMPPKNTYRQLVTRPPFSQTRRPPRAKPAPKPDVQKPAAPPPPAPVAEPQITLVGIVIHAGKSVAMVRKPGENDLLRLAKGADLDGWLVEGVLPDRLLLSHGEKLLELELTEATQKSTASGVGAAPARPRRQ